MRTTVGCAALVIVLVHQSAVSDQRAQGGPSPADLIILNGKVYPGNGGAFQQALAVRGNRIVLTSP